MTEVKSTRTIRPLKRPVEAADSNFWADYDEKMDPAWRAVATVLLRAGVFDEIRIGGLRRGTVAHERYADIKNSTIVSSVRPVWPDLAEDVATACLAKTKEDHHNVLVTPSEVIYVADCYGFQEAKVGWSVDATLYHRFAHVAAGLPRGSSLHRFERDHSMDLCVRTWGFALHVRPCAVVLRIARKTIAPLRAVSATATASDVLDVRETDVWTRRLLELYQDHCGLPDEHEDIKFVSSALLDSSFDWSSVETVERSFDRVTVGHGTQMMNRMHAFVAHSRITPPDHFWRSPFTAAKAESAFRPMHFGKMIHVFSFFKDAPDEALQDAMCEALFTGDLCLRGYASEYIVWKVRPARLAAISDRLRDELTERPCTRLGGSNVVDLHVMCVRVKSIRRIGATMLVATALKRWAIRARHRANAPSGKGAMRCAEEFGHAAKRPSPVPSNSRG